MYTKIISSAGASGVFTVWAATTLRYILKLTMYSFLSTTNNLYFHCSYPFESIDRAFTRDMKQRERGSYYPQLAVQLHSRAPHLSSSSSRWTLWSQDANPLLCKTFRFLLVLCKSYGICRKSSFLCQHVNQKLKIALIILIVGKTQKVTWK